MVRELVSGSAPVRASASASVARFVAHVAGGQLFQRRPVHLPSVGEQRIDPIHRRVNSGRGQNRTLREKAPVECTVDDPLADTARANTRLHKGEAHHALKNALWIGRQGEIRDRSSEGQRYRMAGLNLLAAIVIYWNTAHLGEAVRQRKHSGLTVEPKLLAQISPLGWAHILLTGEYRWPKRR